MRFRVLLTATCLTATGGYKNTDLAPVGHRERHRQWGLMKSNFGTRWEGQTRCDAGDDAPILQESPTLPSPPPPLSPPPPPPPDGTHHNNLDRAVVMTTIRPP